MSFQVRVVLALSSLALLATSGPDSSTPYTIERRLSPTSTELTTELTTRVYQVSFAIAGVASVQEVHATVVGEITSQRQTQGVSPYVSIRVGHAAPVVALPEREAEARFLSSRERDTFTFELSRLDDGENGGTVTVDWALGLRAVVRTADGLKPDARWDISVEEL